MAFACFVQVVRNKTERDVISGVAKAIVSSSVQIHRKSKRESEPLYRCLTVGAAGKIRPLPPGPLIPFLPMVFEKEEGRNLALVQVEC